MRATFTPEQEQLAEVAIDMGAGGIDSARGMRAGSGRDVEPTRSLFTDFSGLGVPESAGGLGGGLVDVAIVVEGLARTVTPTPWVAHTAATQLAFGAGIDVGEMTAGGEVFVPADLAVGDGSTVIRAVCDGQAAQRVVGYGVDGVTVAAVSSSEPRPGLDLTRPLADLTLGSAITPVPAGVGVERAAVVAAADLCGVGRGAILDGAAYAAQRQQFGQPIGKFQGVAYQLAEALANVEAAWALTVYAAWALDADVADARQAAHAAKARAGHAAVHAAERALQVHGGIGMTWEADSHLFLRRALASDAWLGTCSSHRRTLARSLVGTRT